MHSRAFPAGPATGFFSGSKPSAQMVPTSFPGGPGPALGRKPGLLRESLVSPASWRALAKHCLTKNQAQNCRTRIRFPRSAKKLMDLRRAPAGKKGDPPESSTPTAVRQQTREGAKPEIQERTPKPPVNPLRQGGPGQKSGMDPQKRVLVRPPPTKYRPRKIDVPGPWEGR